MNDPGLDAPAQQAAEDVEENVHEAEEVKAEAEEEDFLSPRYVTSCVKRSIPRLTVPVVGGSRPLRVL